MLKEAIYNSLGGSVKLIFGFFSVILLLNSLGSAKYGIWTLIFSFYNILFLLDGGIGASVVYFLASNKSDKRRDSIDKYISTIGFLLGVIVLVFFVIIFLSRNYFINYLENKANGLNIGSIPIIYYSIISASIITVFQQFLFGIFQAFLAFKTLNILKSIFAILSNVILVALAFYYQDICLMCLSNLFLSFFFLLFTVYIIKRDYLKGFEFNTDFTKFSEICKYSFASWGGYIGSSMFSQMDKVIAGQILGNTELGFYSAITNLASYINIISSTPIRSLLTHSSISKGSKSKDEINNKINRSVELTQIVAFIVSVFILLYINIILNIIVSDTNLKVFSSSITVVIYFIYSLNSPGYFYLLGQGKAGYTAFIVLISGVISLLLMYVFGNKWGLIGVLAGNMGYILTTYLTISVLDKRKDKFKFYKTLVINLLCFSLTVIILFYEWHNIIKVLLICIVSFISLIINHKKTILSLFRKIIAHELY